MNTLGSVLRHTALVVLALTSNAVLAAAAGTVTHLSGTLSVQRADGSVRILSQKSEVNQGDILSTQRDSYAQINFTDGSSLTMRPETQMKVEQYNFVQDQPQNDNSFLRLVKGGLRTVTGLVGKRGNQDAYKIGTNTATIGIRGSSGDTLVVVSGSTAEITPATGPAFAGVGQDGITIGHAEGVLPEDSGFLKVQGAPLPPGLYHTTYSGAYIAENGAGSQIIGEGQFLFVKDFNTAPTLLPGDPGLNLRDMPFVLGAPGGACVVR